jgi:hypothetical protein
MSYTPLPPDLHHCVKVAAAWYDLSASKYVQLIIQRAIDEVADNNPVLREAFKYQRLS